MAWVEGKAQNWTPTVTQSGAVAVTVTTARYSISGDICHVQVLLAITGSGTSGNAIIIGGQPAAIQPANTGGIVMGSVRILDTGTAFYVGSVVAVGATDFRFYTDGTANYVGISPAFGLANGDSISFQASYEI